MKPAQSFKRKILLGTILIFAALLIAALPIQADSDRGFTKVTLKNGLKVMYKIMKGQSQVSINAVFPIGFNCEAKKGIAHLHEHLVFRGSAAYNFDDIAGVTIREGGQFSGETGLTATQYTYVASKDNFAAAFNIFNDSLWNTNISDTTVALEKKVVLHELNMDYSERYQYYPIFHYFLPEFDYNKAAATYDAITPTDIQKFHRDYYQPENATYILTGDFDPQPVLTELETISNGYGKGENLKPEPRVFDIPAQNVEENRNLYPYQYEVMLAYEFSRMPERDRLVLELLGLIYGEDSKINYEQNEFDLYQMFYRHVGDHDYFGIYYLERNHPYDTERFRQRQDLMLRYFREFKKIDLKREQQNLARMVELETAESQETAVSAAEYEVNRLADPDFITTDTLASFEKITVKDLERVVDQYFKQPSGTWIVVKTTKSGGNE